MMEAVDVYKLLFQGVFGVGHLMHGEARHRLQSEAEGLDLDEQPDEPLIEEISIDGDMVRANLRPYLRRKLPLDKLFEAMKASSPENGAEEFLRAWKTFRALVDTDRLNFPKEDVEELSQGLGLGEIPARHHSEAYRKAYSPAYRVVKRSEIRLILSDKILGLC